jgi:hypothetical protein
MRAGDEGLVGSQGHHEGGSRSPEERVAPPAARGSEDQVQGDLGPAQGREHDQGAGRDLLLPNGSSKKAVIELTDGDATKTVLVHGLTGRIQQVSGELDDVDTHMLRNALGERDKQREIQ